MKDQIIFIHGGETFDTKEQYYAYLEQTAYDPFEEHKKWRDQVALELDDRYEMLAPSMPNRWFADYRSWSIWFKKLFPYLHEGKLVVIGHSLGTVFLCKYLSENTFPKPIDQLHLVAPVFDRQGLPGGETLNDFILDPQKLPQIAAQARDIYIYSSRDDMVVPYTHGERYHAALPGSHFQLFEDRGHFIQPELPELVANIKKLDTA